MEHLHPARSLFLFLIEAKLSRAQARRGAALPCFFLAGGAKTRYNEEKFRCGAMRHGLRGGPDMKKLTARQYAALASMLFGMFFGAGNLIFPVYMGQLAGSRSPAAIAGFLVTGVGLPLLGIVALGVSRSSGLLEMASRVSRGYGLAFTCALYLTIGPLFAIPRTATVSFSVSAEAVAGTDERGLLIFSAVFFAAVLFFSLRPSGILTWIGKIINPLFLVFLGILVAAALARPMASAGAIAPQGTYENAAFFTGFLEGYNTMDLLASLAFGIVVVNVVRGLGVEEPRGVAAAAVRSGVFSMALMAAIYAAITVVGAQSRGQFDVAENGGVALTLIAKYYFGAAGGLLLAGAVIFACLKTAIGLVTSCGEMFSELFPRSMPYRGWAVLFSAVSFLIANFGLNAILEWSLPVLRLLYPLSIVLILLNTFGGAFGYAKCVFAWTTWCTFPAALIDFAAALPAGVREALNLTPLVQAAERWLPLFDAGLGWVSPAVFGFAIGVFVYAFGRARESEST